MTSRGLDLPPSKRLALDVLSLVEGKWHPVVLLTLEHHGPLGFNALLEKMPDTSGKVLSETLGALEDIELIQRTVMSESPLRVEYELTDAGRDMKPIFEALTAWGNRHLETTTSTVLIADDDRRITDMYSQWLADHYTVVRVHNSDEFEAELTEAIDVVILSDDLPGANYTDVLRDSTVAFRTILLVGDRPRLDLLGIDCDDILRKPMVRDTALEAVETQLRRAAGDEGDGKRERDALAAKLSFLRSVHPPDTLAADDAFARAAARLEVLEAELE